uniref:Uncharacterized protein n=1 Tax=Triticum urartu TaxID=4572 RepID=A0A8R7UT17_TRIUA
SPIPTGHPRSPIHATWPPAAGCCYAPSTVNVSVACLDAQIHTQTTSSKRLDTRQLESTEAKISNTRPRCTTETQPIRLIFIS